jgi:hypothetical protein
VSVENFHKLHVAMHKLSESAHLKPDQLVERWTVYLKETQREAFHLYSSRYAFENIQRMYQSNPELAASGGHIYDWLHRNFYTEYLISIRGEMDDGGGFLTLVNFLHELEHYSEKVLTRKRYVALYQNSVLKEYGIPGKHFDEKPGATKNPNGNADDDYISAASIREAREQLQRDTKRAVDFANWFVAHRTRHPPVKMTLADMYRALNRIFDTYAVYYNIITAATWGGRYPTPQYDWFKPFTIPWIAKDFKEFEPSE